MPKIRDLAINAIPLMAVPGGGKEECWFYQTQVPPPEPCAPTPPPCHPTNKPQCNPSPPPDRPDKYVGGLPDHAVVQLRQQLQNQIGKQLHS